MIQIFRAMLWHYAEPAKGWIKRRASCYGSLNTSAHRFIYIDIDNHIGYMLQRDGAGCEGLMPQG